MRIKFLSDCPEVHNPTIQETDTNPELAYKVSDQCPRKNNVGLEIIATKTSQKSSDFWMQWETLEEILEQRKNIS